jgi:hypothetical protein
MLLEEQVGWLNGPLGTLSAFWAGASTLHLPLDIAEINPLNAAAVQIGHAVAKWLTKCLNLSDGD